MTTRAWDYHHRTGRRALGGLRPDCDAACHGYAVHGNEVLAEALNEIRALGIKATVYSHPIGAHGHGAGPLIGLWDRQQGVPGRGDVKLIPDTWFSIELSSRTPVPEWANQELFVGMEEDAMVGSGGKIQWVLRRQEKFHLIR